MTISKTSQIIFKMLTSSGCRPEILELVTNHNFEDKNVDLFIKSINQLDQNFGFSEEEEIVIDRIIKFAMTGDHRHLSNNSSDIPPHPSTDTGKEIRDVQSDYDGDPFEYDGYKLF
jgi:hypothetical protein